MMIMMISRGRHGETQVGCGVGSCRVVAKVRPRAGVPRQSVSAILPSPAIPAAAPRESPVPAEFRPPRQARPPKNCGERQASKDAEGKQARPAQAMRAPLKTAAVQP